MNQARNLWSSISQYIEEIVTQIFQNLFFNAITKNVAKT